MVEDRVEEFRLQQQELMAAVSSRMQSFVAGELEKLSSTQAFLEANVSAFEGSEKEVSEQTKSAKEEMDAVLEEIKTLREDVKARVGEGLQGLSAAAERISAEVISELGAFHTQLHTSYSSLGRDFKSLFEDLLKHIEAQRTEADALRHQLNTASKLAMQANAAASTKLEDVLREEREQAATDRQTLLSQITNLVMAQGETQDARLGIKIAEVQKDILASKDSFETSQAQYSQGMVAWNEKEGKLVEEVLRSRETLKSKLKEDWVAANKHNASLQQATKSVHAETVRIVDEQIKDMESQMRALDDFVTRARSQNAQHHDSHAQSLQNLSSTVKSSYSNISSHFTSTYERVRNLGDEMSAKTATLQETLEPLNSVLRQPLSTLRENITSTQIQDYQPTGETPQKIQYTYPTSLPRTEAHETLLAALRRPSTSSGSRSPSKSTTSMVPVIFNDTPSTFTSQLQNFSASLPVGSSRPSEHDHGLTTSALTGLREVDINVTSIPAVSPSEEQVTLIPSFKRSVSANRGNLPVLKSGKKSGSVVPAEGRENILAQSTGRRRSPRNG